LKRSLALLAVVGAFGCAHGEPDIATLASSSDKIIWDAGQKAFEKKNWESARQHYKRIVDGFPQSEFGPAARVGLADSYYREGGIGNYILAVSAYRDFLTLYPSHPRSDYAQFMVGESFYRQRNGPDRDQTPTIRALGEYERLLDVYPSSTYVEPARQRITECRQALARGDHMVGYFYQRTRQAYRAAIARYETIITDFPDYKAFDEVLFRLAECLAAMRRPAEALPHLGRLVQEYPQSEYAEPARKLMTELSAAPPAPPPAAPPGVPRPSPSPTPRPKPSGPS
jgi:outer membrane protein assembly factor BamD